MASLPLQLARALAASRVLFGAGIIAAPRLTASVWVGPRRAASAEAAVLGRALGARDTALGAATLGAFASKDTRLIRAALAACALCDGTDLLATLAERRRLPSGPAAFSALAAGGSTAIALAALATTTRNDDPRPTGARMTDDDRPADPAPEDATASGSEGGQTAEDFKREVEEDPSANPPEELDRLRGG